VEWQSVAIDNFPQENNEWSEWFKEAKLQADPIGCQPPPNVLNYFVPGSNLHAF
jgi:hypothetical protein